MDDDDRQDLIRRLFALLTARLEDDAAVAAESQGDLTADEHRARASQIRSGADTTTCLVDAIIMLLK